VKPVIDSSKRSNANMVTRKQPQQQAAAALSALAAKEGWFQKIQLLQLRRLTTMNPMR